MMEGNQRYSDHKAKKTKGEEVMDNGGGNNQTRKAQREEQPTLVLPLAVPVVIRTTRPGKNR